MEEPARRFFESRKLCVCVKDQDKLVLYQNKACLELCGDMSLENCGKSCMLCYNFKDEAPQRVEGTQYCPNELIEGEFFDILFINDGENLTTLLYPLKGKHQADIRHISKYDLTKREKEIVQLVIEGLNNTAIAKKLFVSKATVKKHLNNIYKKVPMSAFPR